MAIYRENIEINAVNAFIQSKTIVLANNGEVVVGIQKIPQTTTITRMGNGYNTYGGSYEKPTGFVTIIITTTK